MVLHNNHKHTILLVDNDSVTQDAIKTLLPQERYQVHIVSRGEEAIAFCMNSGIPDVILMSDVHGLATCDQLKDIDKDALLSVIMLTEKFDDDAVISQFCSAGVSACHMKPIRPTLLRQRISQLLQMKKMQQESKQIEAALLESQQTLEMALEAAEVGTWDWDVQSGKINFGSGWARMLDYQPDEIENTFESWQQLVHMDDVEHWVGVISSQLAGDIPYAELEYRMKTRSGDWIWVQSKGRVMVRDADGTPLRMMGTQKDIDKLKRAEAARKESEERYRIISSTISDYAYSCVIEDDGTMIRDWSTKAFFSVTGYDQGDLNGYGWEKIIHPDDKSLFDECLKQLLGGQSAVSEFRIIARDGEVRWVRDHMKPVVDENTGNVVRIYGAAQDITQQKRDEALLRQQAEQLAARNEELDAFAYTVAHDLKNPIASMMGFASLVRSYYHRMTDENILEHIDLIMEGGYKLREIIDALLLLAGVNKVEKPQVEPVNMAIVVENSLQRLASMISETQAEFMFPDDWPVALAYAPWVEEIWMNYVSNALKYGGTPPIIELGGEMQTDGMVRFWVKDNGKGLTAEQQMLIFTPFTRLRDADDEIEGHGLGLSVVQRIVAKLGGETAVESVSGHGSVFSFTLPKSLS